MPIIPAPNIRARPPFFMDQVRVSMHMRLPLRAPRAMHGS